MAVAGLKMSSWDRLCNSMSVLRAPRNNLQIDESFVARLTDFIGALALKGMAQQA